jgi:hypothetical protein
MAPDKVERNPKIMNEYSFNYQRAKPTVKRKLHLFGFVQLTVQVIVFMVAAANCPLRWAGNLT